MKIYAVNAILLCAGDQSRWGDIEPKQLFVECGESLLARSVRQIRERGGHSIVAERTRYKKMEVGDEFVRIGKTRCTLHTLWKTQDFWTEPFLVLCGDVFWTDAAMDELFADGSEPMTFLTNTHEIFGVHVSDKAAALKSLDEINPGEIRDGYYGRAGRLGRWFRHLRGISDADFDYGKNPGPVSGPMSVLIKDGTHDHDWRDRLPAECQGRR